jgi:hypothetical protein
MRVGSLALLFAVLASGCAREALPTMPEWSRPEAQADPLAMGPPRKPRHGFLSLTVPDGDACLRELADQGATFLVMAPKPGMRTPVSVLGSLGGIKYRSGGASSLVCDCRLAVVLGRLGPEFYRMGVTEVRHMGAYAYRTTRAGRTSLHAFGLAIDVGGVDVAGRRLSVAGDFRHGGSCEPDAPPLNLLACDLRHTGFSKKSSRPTTTAITKTIYIWRSCRSEPTAKYSDRIFAVNAARK